MNDIGLPSGITIADPASRAEWLSMRRQDVTASQIGSLLGVHPYCTRLQLFLEKTGRKVDDADLDSAAMRRGRLLESLAYTLARDALPTTEMVLNDVARYWRDPARRIGATPDILALDSQRGRGVIQLKSVEPSIFRRTWLDGEPPTWVALQALTEAKLTGAQWAAVGALRVGHAVEFDLIDIPLTTRAWDALTEAVAGFWNMVEREAVPQPDYARDGKLIAAIAGPSDSGVVLDLSSDNELVSALHDRELYKAQLKSLETELAAIDAQVRHKAGAAEVIAAGDFRITLRSEQMNGYTVAARERRPIRIKRIRGETAA